MIGAMREMEQSSFDFFGSQETKKDKKKIRKQEDDFVFEFMDIFTAPIIVYNESWGKGLPEDLLRDITLGRNIQILKKEKEASIPEMVAYLMTVCNAQPTNSMWTKVYLWVCGEYIKRFKRVKEIPDFLKEEKELSDYEKNELRRLSQWIYKKRREALKIKLRELN